MRAQEIFLFTRTQGAWFVIRELLTSFYSKIVPHIKAQPTNIKKIDNVLAKLMLVEVFDCAKRSIISSLGFCLKNDSEFKHHHDLYCKKYEELFQTMCKDFNKT